MTKFRIKAPAFRLKRGSKPVFLNERHLIHLGSRSAALYDVDARSKHCDIKTCSNATELAVSREGDWIATKNSSGELVVSRLSDGQSIHKYSRPPYQDSGQLAACGDGEHFLDSTDGVVNLHSALTGRIVDSHEYGTGGWMSEGLIAAPGLGAFFVAATPKSGNRFWHRGKSIIHRVKLNDLGSALSKVKLKGQLERFALSPDETRLAAVFATKDIDQLEVRVMSLDGRETSNSTLSASSVYFGSPVWTPDGQSIVVITDLSRILLLNAESLAIEKEFEGPRITGIAFQPDGHLVCLTGESGYGGIVAPLDQLEAWVADEGRPRRQRLDRQFKAYKLQVDLRKACPPRAAVFMCGNRLLFETERLVGYFRYLPGEVVAELDRSEDLQALGKALRRAMGAFEDHPEARSAVMGPHFPGEEERLAEVGVPLEKMTSVRYLGHEIPYRVDHSDVDVMLSVIAHEGNWHFFLCRHTGDGRFHEMFWPHMEVPQDASDPALGKALTDAIQAFPDDTKVVE